MNPQALKLLYPHLFRQRYAKKKEEPSGEDRWITIGGKEGEKGKHEGGFPVLIGSDGEIKESRVGGLHGKKVGEVKGHFDQQKQGKQEPEKKEEPAKPAEKQPAKSDPLANVPQSVQDKVKIALDRLHGIKKSVETAARAGGRYEADAWKNLKMPQGYQEDPDGTIAKFRQLAQKNGIDADAAIEALGGIPDLKPSKAAQQWLDNADERHSSVADADHAERLKQASQIEAKAAAKPKPADTDDDFQLKQESAKGKPKFKHELTDAGAGNTKQGQMFDTRQTTPGQGEMFSTDYEIPDKEQQQKHAEGSGLDTPAELKRKQALGESLKGKEESKEQLPEHVSPHELSKMDKKLAQLKAKMEKTQKVWDKPQQTPGAFETGRSGYTQGKKLDAENNRKADAFREYQRAEQDHRFLQARRQNYLDGKVHPNGQPRVPGAVEERKAAKERNQEKVKEQGYDMRAITRDISMDGHSTLPDGRKVSLDMNLMEDPPNGGYRYRIESPDGNVQHTPYEGGIASLQKKPWLRKALQQKYSRTSTAALQVMYPQFFRRHIPRPVDAS